MLYNFINLSFYFLACMPEWQKLEKKKFVTETMLKFVHVSLSLLMPTTRHPDVPSTVFCFFMFFVRMFYVFPRLFLSINQKNVLSNQDAKNPNSSYHRQRHFSFRQSNSLYFFLLPFFSLRLTYSRAHIYSLFLRSSRKKDRNSRNSFIFSFV